MLKIKRIYEPEAEDDGYRILVDRLWPRGMSKVRADLNAWDKEAAPDNSLRKAFHDHEEDYAQFVKDYLDELNHSQAAKDLVSEVREHLKDGNVTLLYGSKDQEHNNAVVLLEWLQKQLSAGSSADDKVQSSH